MCNPYVFQAIAMVVTVATAVHSAEAQKQTGRYNQQLAENNATLAMQSARDANIRGSQEASERRLKTRMMLGTQRATLAANGVDLQFGTPLEILGDTAMFGQIDEGKIRMNAAREAWGFQTEAANWRAQGAIARYEGDAGAFGTYLGAAATLASQSSDMAGGMSFGGFGGGGKSLGTSGTSMFKGGSTFKAPTAKTGRLKPFGG